MIHCVWVQLMISLYHLYRSESPSIRTGRDGLQNFHPHQIYDSRRASPFLASRNGQKLGETIWNGSSRGRIHPHWE